QITVEKNNTHRGNMFTGSGVFTDTGMDLTLWYIVHRLVKCCCPRGKCSCAASEDSARDSVHVLVWIVQHSCACVCVCVWIVQRDSVHVLVWIVKHSCACVCVCVCVRGGGGLWGVVGGVY